MKKKKKFPREQRFLIAILITLFSIVLVLAAVFPGDTKVEWYETGGDANVAVVAANEICQTFTIGTLTTDRKYNFTGFGFKVGCNGCSARVYLRDVNSTGWPDSNLTSEVAASLPGAGATWNNQTMGNSGDHVALQPATQYAVCFEKTGGGSVTWETDEAGATYVGGSRISINASDAWTNHTASDFQFQIYGNLIGLGPTVTLNKPPDAEVQYFRTVTINCSSSDTVPLLNVSLTLNATDVTTVENTTAGELELSLQTNKLFDYGSDNNWSCNSVNNDMGITTSSLRYFNVSRFRENSQTFNSSVSEFSAESFLLNISYNSTHFTSSSANLFYNGTSYLGTKTGSGDTVTFSRALDIPGLTDGATEIRDFYWEVILTNSTTSTKINSSLKQQTVTESIFVHCNATYEKPVFVNYTTYTETGGALLNTTFDATFNYRLKGTTTSKNYTFTNTNQNSSFKFCTNINETYIIDATIELNATGYHGRTYHFNEESYTNITTEESLYLLNETEGSNIIIEVKNNGLQPIEGYFVEINRFFPATNEYKTVINEKTDEFGIFSARLIENTVKYRFQFKNPSGSVVKTTQDMAIACKTSICVMSFVIENTSDYFEQWDNLTDFDYDLNFDTVTNEFSYTWNDQTGDSTTNRLLVERIAFNGTTTVCNSTSTSDSSTLTCNVGGTRNHYRAQAFRTVSGGNEKRIAILNIQVGNPADTFGLEGFIWSFLLLFTLIGVGSFNPPLGVVLYMGGFFALGALGVISFNIPIFFAMLVIGIAFIWAFRG